MNILCVGTSHRTAPVEVRERVAFLESRLGTASALLRAREGLHEAVILSTCNRTEAYVVAEDASVGTRAVLDFWCDYHGLAPREMEPYVYALWGLEAVRHLFRVAAGLDSMMVGEVQILGQVREAFGAARGARATGPLLDALFRHAIAAGRRVRQRTGIERGSLSVPEAAVELARRLLGGLAGRRVLVLGAGEMAELTVRHLLEAGCGAVVVCNRTLEHARPLAERLGGMAVRFDELGSSLARADILVTSTAAPHPVVEPELVAQAVQGRREPLLIVDIAVPRDVHPAVGQLPGVRLLNVDDLRAVSEATRQARQTEIAHAEGIVAEELDRFAAWLRSLKVVPLITALRARAEAVAEEEWRRALPRLRGLTEEEREAVRGLLQSVVNRLLHGPIVRLKEIARREDSVYVEAARTLLGFEVDGPQAAGESKAGR
ncbi:MAG: glutamyl-tRNA reductase [Armatimonadota bacterium]|nr:glutamyl-tRNA reductase [Armatimonadota bacterium]MDR7577819.1 glutamyl-tRNA reductase [Armatimonadota bacterium]MDR7580783.1 glutamyl-tRNA reductase [Armatimonadota bacterium]MDR7594613.1 glutamyl-tRNA reductase [Armatimonadota bacterium]MDR7617901.1 glutamyl-tRNA reductase [Armatimonadota bacterium]